MKKLFISLAVILSFFAARANDGSFDSEGNHLIPIVETDISVQKEILTVTRHFGRSFWYPKYYVTVYYEFFNPSEEKDLLVGFEAMPPSEGLGGPEIINFKVIMNGDSLDYQISSVPKKEYYIDGQFQRCEQEEEGYWDPCLYVYHFNAHFKKGLNIIQHSYIFNGASDNMSEFVFDYVLTAANRWANNGIDDFTLILDIGDRESFMVDPKFFNDANEFTCDGKGIITTTDRWGDKVPTYHIQEGKIVFHKKNFHPNGELLIYKPDYRLITYQNKTVFLEDSSILDIIKKQYINFYRECDNININNEYKDDEKHIVGGKAQIADETKRILKNLPFAYRGYVFKNKDLQQFFESTKWYIPNPEYKPDMNVMSKDEKDWIKFWSE